MNIAVIGAGRSVNGIGPYIARYFQRHGMPVVAVLGRSDASSTRAAAELEPYGIRAAAHSSFKEMIEKSRPDAVAIASPTATHAAYIEQCLAAGVHIFCDKPFAAPETPDLTAWLVSVLRRAHTKGLTIAMNSQWPFVLPFYVKLCGKVAPDKARTFTMRLSPGVSGPVMIPDSLPHGLSLLYDALGNGVIKALSFKRESDAYLIGFTYSTDRTRCAVTITLVQELCQPRTLSFGFDGRIAARRIDPAAYAMSLTCRGKSLAIPDPLELSVKDFIDSLAAKRTPRIAAEHIARTTMLLQQIHDAAIRLTGTLWKN